MNILFLGSQTIFDQYRVALNIGTESPHEVRHCLDAVSAREHAASRYFEVVLVAGPPIDESAYLLKQIDYFSQVLAGRNIVIIAHVLGNEPCEATALAVMNAGALKCIQPSGLSLLVQLRELEKFLLFKHEQTMEHDRSMQYGEVRLHKADLCMIVCRKRIPLTPSETAVMHILINLRGGVVHRSLRLDTVLPENQGIHNRSLDAHIKRIRRKINVVMEQPTVLIETVYGAGYRLRQEPKRARQPGKAASIRSVA